MSRSTVLAIAGLIGILGSGLTIALAQSSGSMPTKLHEDIEVPKDQRAVTSERLGRGVPIIGPKPEARQNPTAIASQGKLLPEPSGDASAEKGEPVHGRGGFGADRKTESRADYFTGADNELHYIEVFNPSIVPFKRMSSLDAVREDYTLVTNSAARADVAVGGEPRAGRDLFWGSVMVQLRPGFDVPIPSVAAGMRILSYETTPATNLIFSKDAADNYYLRTDEAGSTGTYKAVFLSEASPSYFAPASPRNMLVSDIPKGKVAKLPPNVQLAAQSVLDKLRLHDKQPVDEVLNELVRYFRSFDAKSPPQNTGNVYLDLVNSQAGVCRHRSFAFMITASAVGIPTRYVSNEAHAWVEVWLPDSNWMRIDLGGAASTLNVSNASDKAMYRPRGEDPFPKPEAYEENYTRLEGDVKGLREEQIAERQETYAGSGGQGEGNGSFFGEGAGEAESEDPFDDEGPLAGPGSNLPETVDERGADKIPTRAQVTLSADTGYRGESFDVTASLVDVDGNGIGGMLLNVFIAPAGNGGNDSFRIGRGVTNDEGLAIITVELPTDEDLRIYEVYVGYNGNKTYQNTVSK
ncbi:MAG: transglutaminase domain-containing protein [Myxococcales bacterium]|nr:transglutaminase domain-containing protein [Myxococcales bacterium]